MEGVESFGWVVLGLNYEQRYPWGVRATASYVDANGKSVDTFGPWSAFGSFITPQNKGYIRGNELYDPLFNGETIGNIVGPAPFAPSIEPGSIFLAFWIVSPPPESAPPPPLSSPPQPATASTTAAAPADSHFRRIIAAPSRG